MDLEKPFPHHTQVFAGTQRYAKEAHWQCIIDDYPGYRPNRRSTIFHEYDGVIARARPRMVQRMKRRGVPIVNTWFSSPVRSVPGVYADFQAVARLATEHLLDRGFRRLCYFSTVGEKDAPIVRKTIGRLARETGAAFYAFEHPAVDSIDAELWLEQERVLSQALEQLEPPVGICCSSTTAIRSVVNLCQGRGWGVPSDAAVISIMGTSGIIDHPSPTLSYVEMNWERVGYEAAAMLDRMMGGDDPPSEPILVPPIGVVARESTDYFAIGDPLVSEVLQ
ncbi:MAG: substrate-binding domain-containing protein, partial [Rhodospirillales bacterium]|nr:substrate-binding domain-containing protein [Rhodospirillales bacterium]